MSRKLEQSVVNDYFSEFGYIVKSTYLGYAKPLIVQCPIGHEYSISLDVFKRGSRCQLCEWESRKKNPDEIHSFLKKKGYRWVSGEYINAHQKITVECDKAHSFDIPWAALSQGAGCPKCAKDMASLRYRKDFNLVLSDIKSKGIEYVSGEYINGTSKMTLFCPAHGKFQRSYDSVMSSKYPCPKCAKVGAAEFHRKDLDEIIKNIESYNFKYISGKYKNNMSKLKVECDKGHIFSISWANFSKGKRCPSCAVYGFNTAKKGILYYLRVEYRNKTYYKIGITNRSINDRFNNSDLEKITILKTWKHKRGFTSYKKEQAILKKYSEYRYRGKTKVLQSGGNTELFTKDVLGLDL